MAGFGADLQLPGRSTNAEDSPIRPSPERDVDDSVGWTAAIRSGFRALTSYFANAERLRPSATKIHTIDPPGVINALGGPFPDTGAAERGNQTARARRYVARIGRQLRP